jgi:prepilin-type N-terminal cleavage/methylation domain-containing protein
VQFNNIMSAQNKSSGFTLIELLIVVTLIGILAVAVLSAIDPIEQVNKTRDAGKKADANQLVSAIERYYASTLEYPWNNNSYFDNTAVGAVDADISTSVTAAGVGVCGDSDWDPATNSYGNVTSDDQIDAAGCEVNGILINGQELKTQFTKRSEFSANARPDELMYLIKEGSNISVCFIPSSRSARQDSNNLWTVSADITGFEYSGSGGGTPVTLTACTTPPADNASWTTYTTLDETCMICVPER